MAGKVGRTEESVSRRERRLRDEARLQALQNIHTLHDLPPHELRWLGRHATLRVFADQATIVTERMPNEYLYVVLRGTVTIDLHDRIGQQVSLGVLPVGAIFGESPLCGTHFSGVSVVARSPSELLQISVEALQTNRHQLAALFERLHDLYRHRLIRATLARVPFLASLHMHEREALIQQLLVRDVRRGEYIVRAGQPPNGLHLIESGQFMVERQGQVIAHLDEGDFIGAMAMMTNTPAHDDVRAVTPCQVLTLPGLVFMELLQTHPEISATITRVLQERSAHVTQQQSIADAIAQRGVRRGDRIFVREADRCPPDCRLCVSACGTRHGVPRLRYDGLAYGQVQLLDSCRQCRVGAECVEACPEDAIVWDGHRLVISESCTGCGACVQACNYDAVQLVPLNRSWVGALQRQLQRIPIIALQSTTQAYRADKCDFCAGHDDMACISACPIGALKLVPVESILPY